MLAVLVVLAGCSSVPLLGHPDDPGGDRIGWENGYWYDDPVEVTPEDGYNASEREAVVARTMARVERIRDLEFEETVPVEVVSRDQYLANRSGGGGDSNHEAWNDQIWEGIFIVGESTGTGESFNSTLGASVQGYYSPGEDQIVLVSDSPTPTIDRATLAHELVHALQDQQFGFGPGGDTQDQQLANDGVIEGEANYIEAIYTRRCDGTWNCIPEPQRGGGGGGGGDINRGLFLTIYQPYATGPTFVDTFRERGGWDAVDRLHEQFPESTEQVIHPQAYPDEDPVNVTVPDRSNGEWERYDHDPVADTLGEASIYAMFVSNDVASPDGNRLSYQSRPSTGWGGDSLVPYRSDDAAAGEGAYVWVTTWDTERDAEEFHRAYLDLLESQGASNPRGNVYVVPDSSDFGDAFRVVRSGDRVRIVNAPTADQLDDVHDPRN